MCLWFMLNLKAEMSELDFCTCIHSLKEYEMAVFLSLKKLCISTYICTIYFYISGVLAARL